MNSPTAEISGQQYQCPVCGAKLAAEMAKPILDAPCQQCGSRLWSRMRTVGRVAILDVLPDRLPADVDRLVESRFGASEAPRIIVNLSGTGLVDSLFLARLLTLRKAVHRVKGRLVLCCSDPIIREKLTYTKLDTLFGLADDEKAALASLESN